MGTHNTDSPTVAPVERPHNSLIGDPLGGRSTPPAAGFVPLQAAVVSPVSDTGTGVPALPREIAATLRSVTSTRDQCGIECLTRDGKMFVHLADHIAVLEHRLAEKSAEISAYDREVGDAGLRILQLEQQLAEKDELIEALRRHERDAIEQRDEEIVSLRAESAAAEADTKRLDWLSHHMAQQRSGDWKAIGLDPMELTLRDAIDARSGEGQTHGN